MQQNNWLNERGQLILLFAGVAGLLFIMFLLDHLINPLGYGLIVGIVLYPIRQQPVARALLYATAFAAGVWLLYDSGHLLIPFIVAYLIAFLINPLVQKVERRNIPRWLLATSFTFVSLGLIALLFIFATPVLVEQLTKIGKLLAEASTNTESLVDRSGILALIENLGFESGPARAQLATQLDGLVDSFYGQMTNLSSGYLSGVGNIVAVLFFLILLPFLCFFMIRDYEKIAGFLAYLFTPQGIDTDYTRQISGVVGSYLRGQFMVVLISMVNLSLGFYLFDVPYALLLGIISGLTNFIPTFGLWFSITLTSLVGITIGDPWYQFLPGIYIVFAIEQVLETGFIVPRVVGKHVGLHPLLVMVSLLLFGFMFGILGLIVAVPTVAFLSILFEQYKETKKITFLRGSELDAFLQQFDTKKKESPDQELESVP